MQDDVISEDVERRDVALVVAMAEQFMVENRELMDRLAQ